MLLLHRPVLSLLTYFSSRLGSVSAQDLAWNGYTPPESLALSPLTPFFVPPGAKAYDSTSPFVSYKGKWIEKFSARYVEVSARFTSQPGAQARFPFTGTGVEWFGSQDRHHGLAIVSLDGEPVEEVDIYLDRTISLKQQRLFAKYDLPYGPHVLTISNVGRRGTHKRQTRIDVDAFVVYRTSSTRSDLRIRSRNDTFRPPVLFSPRLEPPAPSSTWSLVQRGTTGVHAMQIVVISSTHALIVDKVEHNPLTVNGHPAWAALYNLENHSLTPLKMDSNSFCAGGTFLSNGTLINVGGNPVVASSTSPADFGDANGLQAIRLFHPCSSTNVARCRMYENHSRVRMASPRWYNTAIRLDDGSAMIVGGSKKGGWINNSTVNNPTIEFWPPKNIQGSNGLPIQLSFLVRTLYSNLFPIAFVLPSGGVFMAANRDAMLYDWRTGTERMLPQIPNGVRVTYPMAGTGLLLPLAPENNYAAEILLCGGSAVDDTKAGYEISSQEPASAQCSRILLTEDGINAGWQVEQMPQQRIMPDAVLLPTGDVILVNGGETGISGYGNVVNQVGSSNADHPVLNPVLYRPRAIVGQRFISDGMPTSQIPRLYHSVATLTPKGNIMIAGSNPNLDRSEVMYGTEYRVEWLNPPYMTSPRPKIKSSGSKMGFAKTFKLNVDFPIVNKALFLDLKGTTTLFADGGVLALLTFS